MRKKYDFYNRLLKGEDINNVLNDMREAKLYNVIQRFLNIENGSEFVPGGKLDSSQRGQLKDILQILQYIYNNSSENTGVSDSDYDRLFSLYERSGESLSPIISSPSMTGKLSREHTYPDLRGTLDKIHFITEKERIEANDKKKSIEAWLESVKNRYYRNGGKKELTEEYFDCIITPKYDGVSVIFECDKNGIVQAVLTRGDTSTNIALDITKVFPPKTEFPTVKGWDSDFGIKTEALVSVEKFNELINDGLNFDTPRSAATSIINTIDDTRPNMWKFLNIQLLSFQNKDNGEIKSAVEVNPKLQTFIKANLLRDRDKLFDYFKSLADRVMEEKYLCTDGAVVSLTNEEIRRVVGREDSVNKYEFAYKFKPPVGRTILKSVDFHVGALGNIAPVANIEPIKMGGRIVKSVSLGSIDTFQMLNLHKGDEVLIIYEIIPYLTKDSTCKESDGDLIEVPTHCPICNSELVMNPILRCDNPECDSNKMGKILNYVTKMNIPNISEKTIEILYAHGFIKEIPDLYELEKYENEIMDIKGFGKKSYRLLIDSINSKKSCYDSQLLGSIGIPGIGRRIFEKITSIYNIYEILDTCINGHVNRLSVIQGISDITANKIITGVRNNHAIINKLIGILSVSSKLYSGGERIVFTGIRDKDFEQALTNGGNNVEESVTKDTNYVVTNNVNGSTGKLDKARKYGIPILSIEDAYKLFNYKQN